MKIYLTATQYTPNALLLYIHTVPQCTVFAFGCGWRKKWPPSIKYYKSPININREPKLTKNWNRLVNHSKVILIYNKVNSETVTWASVTSEVGNGNGYMYSLVEARATKN